MQVLSDRAALSRLPPDLRGVIEARQSALGDDLDLATFLLVEPGDPPTVLDPHLRVPLLDAPVGFEVLEEHPCCFELVFVLNDDGSGLEVFIPKHPGIDRALLAWCAAHALPASEVT